MPIAAALPYVSAATSVGGLALSAKGAQDQKKAIAKKNAQEQENYEDANQENWRRYLLSRGVDGNRAVNTKLPLWATWPQTA